MSISADITAPSGGLALTAANTSNVAQAITITGNIRVNNFTLNTGTVTQNTASLPVFEVYNSFTLSSSLSTFTRAIGGTGLSSAAPYKIVDVYGLQGMLNSPSSFFELENNIDATGTSNWNSGAGFIPVGTNGAFTGGLTSLTGNYFAINNLYINLPTTNYVGLFSQLNGSSGNISNFYLTNETVIGGSFVGGLAGAMGGSSTVNYVTTTGTVTGMGGTDVGGLVGLTGSSSNGISNSGTTSNVFAYNTTSDVGGLVGYNNGALISVYAAGNVSASGAIHVGGLVGTTTSTILSAYAVGSVTGSTDTGGFVGVNSGATINMAYSSGASSGNGFVGTNTGTILNSYWDTGTSGQAASGAASGVTAGTFDGSSGVNLSTLGAYSGFTITSTRTTTTSPPTGTWFIFSVDNGNSTSTGSRPMLLSEAFSGTTPLPIVTPHQLQLVGSCLGCSYTLGGNVDVSAASTNNADVWGWSSSMTTPTAWKGFLPIGDTTTAFTGSINGLNTYTINSVTYNAYYTVNNLFINSSSKYVGLFGSLGAATISNLGLTNVAVSGTDTNAGSINVGGLAGLIAGATISNSYVTGTVSMSGSGNVTNLTVGGLLGYITSGLVRYSYSAANVTSNDSVGGALSPAAGGFMGGGSGGTIQDSYSIGNVALGSSSPAGAVAGALLVVTVAQRSRVCMNQVKSQKPRTVLFLVLPEIMYQAPIPTIIGIARLTPH